MQKRHDNLDKNITRGTYSKNSEVFNGFFEKDGDDEAAPKESTSKKTDGIRADLVLDTPMA